MPSSEYHAQTVTTIQRNVFYFLLIIAGLVGNYQKFQIFLNIDFIFGSIFAMLALQFFGPARGIQAAAMIASYTYLLWNHPYAIIIMTAEVAVVAWLIRKRGMCLVLADTLYWLCIGMPLVYVFYHLVMKTPLSNTTIVMTKQAINGISNTLIAALIFSGYALLSRKTLVSYRELIFNLMNLFVLCPTLFLLAVSSRTDYSTTDLATRASLSRDTQFAAHILEVWITNRKNTISSLAEMAVSRSPRQMQPHLEQAHMMDANLLRVGLLDGGATTVAFFPTLDELGHRTIGKNFADRPYIPELKQTHRPMLSEVVMAKFGRPRPIVSMLAPVVSHGVYNGYAVGVLSLEQIQFFLSRLADTNSLQYSLLDKNGRVILSNRSDQRVMATFTRSGGTLRRLSADVSQWIPTAVPNIPISERWKNSFYTAEIGLGNPANWKLIMEQPVAPFQKKLYDSYTGKLTLLFLILLGTQAFAEFISRNIAVALKKLGALTNELPSRLACRDSTQLAWPESGITESHNLIVNFRDMADTLAENFLQLRQEVLERQLMAQELAEKHQKLESMSIDLSLAEERERDRIAGELHDQVGQRLILGKMTLGALTNTVTDDVSRDRLNELDQIINLSIQDIRSLTFQLRPPILASVGLEAALHWLGEEFMERYSLAVTFSDDGIFKPMRYETRSTVFQATRELMLNCVKHAAASHIDIHISRDDSMLRLCIADDGSGFAPDDVKIKKAISGGFGLINVRNRIEHLAGKIIIDSRPGEGTRITILAPLDLSIEEEKTKHEPET